MRRAVILVGLLVLAGCGSSGGASSSTTAPTQLTGSVLLKDAVDLSGTIGKRCAGKGGYSDLDLGTPVVVKDASGAIVGKGSLGQGSTVLASQGMSLTYCSFGFRVIEPLPKSDFYSVEVSHRGALTYSADDLKNQDYKLVLTLG